MQEQLLLKKLKNINSYNKPYNPIVKSIVYTEISITCILKELSEMLRDNFHRTEAIIGEEITNLVLSQNLEKYK